MSRERFDRVVTLFHAVRAMSPAERERHLAEECSGDEALRDEVEDLVRQDARLESTGEIDRLERGIAEEARAAIASRPAGTGTPERIGRYRILGTLGSGGMGVVHRAEQDNPRRVVALKVIRAGLPDASARRRFEFEAEVLGRLHHPGIAQIHEAGIAETPDGGRIPYFAMELIEGVPITRYVEAESLAVPDRLELFARVCDAVHHAHQKGVIHRDLKPGNILVVRGGAPPGLPKVLDFGVARLIAAEARPDSLRTAAGQLLGTLAYMSPEQVSGDPDSIDTRSDVYSLGVILHELLCGRLPIDLADDSVPTAARRILEEEPAPLGRHGTRFRGDVETIVATALEKEPDRRYVSAAELAADVRRTLRDEPITARPASTFDRLGKFARRNRPVVVGTALVFLALVAGFIAERVQRRATDRANEELANSNRELERALEGSEKITRFLTDLFLSANPNETAGRNVTIREKLAGVDERMAGFEALPEIESPLRNSIGETLYALGEFRHARKHLERAIEIRTEVSGPEHPGTLRSENSLATVLLALGEYEEALRRAEHAYEGFRGLLGIGHVETLTALATIAKAHDGLGRPHVEEEYRQIADLCAEHLGPEHVRTLISRSALALELQEIGRSEEAEPLFRSVLEARRQTLGPRHPDTINSLSNLGYLLNGTGRYADALPHLEAAYRLARDVLGADHPRARLIGNNLGVSLYALERYDEARPFFESAVSRASEELGPDHPSTLVARGNLAGLLRKTGDSDGALALWPDIMDGLRRSLPPGNPHIAIYGRIHGLTLLDVERFEEAEPILIEAARGIARVFGPDHTRTIGARRSVVELYEAWGRPEEADPWRTEEERDPQSSD